MYDNQFNNNYLQNYFIKWIISISSKFNENQKYVASTIRQQNLSDARDIKIHIQGILNESFTLLRDWLNSYEYLNDTNEAGLVLSLFTCIGYFSGNSVVRITNHISNLNIFLLLIRPSGNLNIIYIYMSLICFSW